MAQTLEQAVAEHTAPLLRGALALGWTLPDAEELVQDTFAAYLAGAGRFEGRSGLRTYLFGILYNKSRELSRKRAREPGSDDLEAEAAFHARFDPRGHWLASQPQGPEAAALNDELASLIAACAGTLPEQQRAAFFLKEAEGLSNPEVCNALGVSDTHLRVLLFRARLRLRECLERSWDAR
jgi:RNA polymerase sigma-70 factor (ECF subfamily)